MPKTTARRSSTRLGLAVALLSATGLGFTAAASAQTTFFYADKVTLNSGQGRTNNSAGDIRPYELRGNSRGVAYTGVWMVNSNGARSSADTYCNSPGCTAVRYWEGTPPTGRPRIHNHGNASVSEFDGLTRYAF